jgi:UPF0042 nucleotide-binding protein
MDLVVLSGVSGSGKTTAVHALEDVGYFCVDNLPAPLLETFLRLADENPTIDRVAVVMDIREASYCPDLAKRLEETEAAGHQITVIFLDCDDGKLIRRFKETRRQHPLVALGEAMTVMEAIKRERDWLLPIRSRAASVINTSELTVHDLKRRIQSLPQHEQASVWAINFSSFGFRHGLPPDADFVFDVRFLPNPYFVESLKDKNGLDKNVADFVLSKPESQKILSHMVEMPADTISFAKQDGRISMTIAVGCTGGHHRSVAMVNALRQTLGEVGYEATFFHRDIDR